jgi:transketolase
MINPDAKLRENLLDAPASAPTRDGFGQALLELGEANPNVVVVCADLAESTRVLPFKEKYPSRYVEAGVAEQNLATVASGLAAAGKIPFITSYATFSPGRNNEQIRTTIAINNVPVKIAGSHAGLSVGPDGATHQALEDMALMRALPNMTVLSPCDAEEARKATIAAAALPGPVYLRLARASTPLMTTKDTPFEVGKAQVMWSSEHKPEAVIFATGPLLWEALRAADALKERIPVEVINIHTVKPLDGAAVLAAARDAGAVVVVEEHQKAGGLGGAIAEYLGQTLPVPIELVGVNDRFGQSGEMKELLKHYGLDAEAIAAAVEKVSKRKPKAA